MNETVFWALIALLNWGAVGDDDAVLEPLVSELSQKSEAEIVQFDEILAKKLYALDTKAHAAEIGEGAYVEGEYFSPDNFLYSRCVVIVNGEKAYSQVLAQPETFPKDMEFESILYVASKAYELRTGRGMDHATRLSYETYSNLEGWK